MMRNSVGGILLVLIGILLLAQNLGWFSLGSLWKLWPLILVAAGLGMLFPRRS